MDPAAGRRQAEFTHAKQQASSKHLNQLRYNAKAIRTSEASTSMEPPTARKQSIPPIKKPPVSIAPLALRSQLDLISRTTKKVPVPTPFTPRSSPKKPLCTSQHPPSVSSNQSRPSRQLPSESSTLPNLASSSSSHSQYEQVNDASAEVEQPFDENDLVSEQEADDNRQKRVRGKTRGLELAKRRRAKERIDIDIPKHTMRAVGDNCQFYITDVGGIVRTHATLQVKGWKDIPRIDVKNMILRVREKFSFSVETHVDDAIEKDMQRRYYRWRYDLHQKFLKHATVEDALSHPPDDVCKESWKYLVELWQDEKWKEKSVANKKNRSQIKTNHCAGTKAFSRIRYENRNTETGETLGQVDTFHLTHYNKKKTSWVDDISEDAFERMQMLRSQIENGEIEHMSEDQIYDSALDLDGCYGYIRGFGAGPKPKSSRLARHRREELDEAMKRVEEANQAAADATKRAEEAEYRNSIVTNELDALKEKTARMDANYEAKTNELQAMMQSIIARFPLDH